MTDKGVAEEIGGRLRSLRLRKNMTQQELAGRVMVSLNSIKALEKGNGKLTTMIAVLREMGALNTLDAFVPPPQVSPLQLAARKGKIRQRATGSRGNIVPEGDAEW